MYSIYYTVFPPGAGGHHLSNIISLGLETTDYDKLEKFYQNNNQSSFHYSPLMTQMKPSEAINWIKSADLPISICGHWTFLFRDYHNLLQIGKLKIIVCDVPAVNSAGWLRMRKGNLWMDNSFKSGEQQVLYTVKMIKQLYQLNDTDVVDVATELIHKQDISGLVYHLNLSTGLSIPADKAQRLHEIWFNKNYNLV